MNYFRHSMTLQTKERFVPSTKQPPLPKGRGTTEGGGGIHENTTQHYDEKDILKDKIRTKRTDRR